MSASIDANPTDAHPRATGLQRIAVPAILAVLTLGAAWTIAANPREPVWDQQALLASTLVGEHVPSPAQGFTSQLIVAMSRPFLPKAPAAHNASLRIVAMVLYVGAAAFLAMALLRREALVVAFLAFVFASQYPFLWLSSELFTGAFLMLAIAFWVRGAPPWLVGGCLAFLGLSKPDVIVVAFALLGYWAWRSRSRDSRRMLVGSFAVALVALLLPGTLALGSDYFGAYGGTGGRSFASFGQHYAALIAPHQLTGPPPNPWTETAFYLDRHFPGAQNMADVVLDHFPRYLEFVALAAVRGLFRAGYVLNYAALAVPCLLWGWHRLRLTAGERERTLALCFIGLIPFVLFAYPHVRYLARFYPIFVLLLLSGFERLQASEDLARRPALLTAGACLAVSLCESLRRLTVGLAGISQDGQYWFPD